ncbi:predicted protein [Culex quinquefasciatus]|uniref:Predicted protein n=1 Tax=Culex quinquefasciatus TaxID=7176 RepID=B0XDD6_CULQU|nr:predicted protein [Culex quinquefasciatus]|eukprot:XP_001867658.1 predicted protein [Culex quinquefasciatus]
MPRTRRSGGSFPEVTPNGNGGSEVAAGGSVKAKILQDVKHEKGPTNAGYDSAFCTRGTSSSRTREPLQSRSEKRCFVCDKPGHFAAKCPEKRIEKSKPIAWFSTDTTGGIQAGAWLDRGQHLLPCPTEGGIRQISSQSFATGTFWDQTQADWLRKKQTLVTEPEKIGTFLSVIYLQVCQPVLPFTTSWLAYIGRK